MNGDPLPRGSNVLRYASPRVASIPGSAFVRRPTDDDGLSVNRPDYYRGTREQQIAEIRRVIHCETRKNGRFFEINVDTAAAHVAATFVEIVMTAVEDMVEPEPPKFPHQDPSHALLKGLPSPDDPQAERIGDLIANCILQPHYPGLV
jgi:hypothetical protein